MTNFLLGMAAGVSLCSLVFGYLVYHLYKLFKYGA
jgi:hypothetical protein